MEISILLALIALSGSLVTAYVLYVTTKKLNYTSSKVNEAQDKKIQVETDKLLFEYKNTVIRELQDQLTIIRKEVDILKTHEILHLEEKIRLESRIEHLTLENKNLANRIIDNKNAYEEDLINLKTKIKEMEQEIKKYKK